MARRENPLPTERDPSLPRPLGEQLRRARRDRGLTLGQLADMLGYSKPYLSAVENGTARPSPAILTAYSAALGLTLESTLERRPETPEPTPSTTPRPVLDVAVTQAAADYGLPTGEEALVRDLLVDDARAKARAIRHALDWWRNPGPVSVCCIPVAGWQWREWPRIDIINAINRAAEEAMGAGIRDLVLILPPDEVQDMERTVRRSPFAERLQRITCVPQPAALGLGHALLHARSAIGARPFALLLPDDQFDRLGGAASLVLRQLVDHYPDGADHLVAVAKLKGPRRQYGIVRLGPGQRRGNRDVALLAEKPTAEHPVFARVVDRDQGTTYAVVGRYVLAPSVLSALAEMERDQPPGSTLELLDALQHLKDHHGEHIAAWVLPAVVQLGRDETIFVAGEPSAPNSTHVA